MSTLIQLFSFLLSIFLAFAKNEENCVPNGSKLLTHRYRQILDNEDWYYNVDEDEWKGPVDKLFKNQDQMTEINQEEAFFTSEQCGPINFLCFTCSCPRDDQIILGRLVTDNATGNLVQQWACYSFSPSCRVKCRQWDGYLGLYKRSEITHKPLCRVPEWWFTSLPTPPAEVEQFLTVGPQGWAVVQTTEPIFSCPNACQNFDVPVCMRKGPIHPYCARSCINEVRDCKVWL